MKETFVYPNGGYEFTVIRKEDILETIDANITDKEVILEIIKHLEIDATKFLNEGKWTGIPYLGSIKFKLGSRMNKRPDQAALIDEAFHTFNKQEYVMFRKQLAQENDREIRNSRYFRWICSISAKRNRKLYLKLVKLYGDNRARVIMASLYQVKELKNSNYYDY